MPTAKRKPAKLRKLLPAGYGPLLAELKTRVRDAQVKAAVSVNRELILLYWHIGREILRAQKAEGWGTKVVERLARDLAKEFPEMGGFSRTNILYMRAFYAAWEPVEIVQQPVGLLSGSAATPASGAILQRAVAELDAPILSQPVIKLPKVKGRQPVAPIVQQLVGQFEDSPPDPLALLPWGTNILLLEKVKDPATRLWYARKAVENGWSRTVLAVQIESRLHQRSGKAITNFERTLPPAQSDLAREVLKDPYTFDFLTLGAAMQERDLEGALVENVQQLLLEMGAGFAFVGRQVHLEIGGEDSYLDLLFYHLRLRCFVVVDLKMQSFEPEFTGKMNYYLSAVDDQMRHKDDAPTIGLLLCRDAKNRLKVEYALRDVKKPIGVVEWKTRLVEALPKNLRGALPSIADIERELNRPRAKNRSSKK
ncbi:MAG: hypothetical protein RL514_4205 [Verrucomicrobiota bacterium]|jgi:predicted nuclease of restriction endonuclease-like (RecB) superfamily